MRVALDMRVGVGVGVRGLGRTGTILSCGCRDGIRGECAVGRQERGTTAGDKFLQVKNWELAGQDVVVCGNFVH